MIFILLLCDAYATHLWLWWYILESSCGSGKWESLQRNDFSRAVCWDGGRGWTAGWRTVCLMWEVWTSPCWAGPQDFSLTVSSKALDPSNHNISVDITTQLRASSERSTNTAEWDCVIPAQRGGLRWHELCRPSVHHDSTHDVGILRGTFQEKMWIAKHSLYLKHSQLARDRALCLRFHTGATWLMSLWCSVMMWSWS